MSYYEITGDLVLHVARIYNEQDAPDLDDREIKREHLPQEKIRVTTEEIVQASDFGLEDSRSSGQQGTEYFHVQELHIAFCGDYDVLLEIGSHSDGIKIRINSVESARVEDNDISWSVREDDSMSF